MTSPNTNIDEHLLMLIRLHFAEYDYNEKIVLEQLKALLSAAKIEGESTGAINILEVLAANGTISKKVKLEMLNTVSAWKELEKQ